MSIDAFLLRVDAEQLGLRYPANLAEFIDSVPQNLDNTRPESALQRSNRSALAPAGPAHSYTLLQPAEMSPWWLANAGILLVQAASPEAKARARSLFTDWWVGMRHRPRTNRRTGGVNAEDQVCVCVCVSVCLCECVCACVCVFVCVLSAYFRDRSRLQCPAVCLSVCLSVYLSVCRRAPTACGTARGLSTSHAPSVSASPPFTTHPNPNPSPNSHPDP